MTDYFALLDQPRRPWLNLEALEEKYRELARKAHPDQSLAQDSSAFAKINEAYRTLANPKSRLQHLLSLERAPARATTTAEVPDDLSDLFMKIAPVLAQNNSKEIAEVLERLKRNYQLALEELRALDLKWNEESEPVISDGEKLAHRFAFLMRWIALVEERVFTAAG